MNFEQTPITKKLAEISEVMSDGYYFVAMRAFVTQWEKEALTGSLDAQHMIEVIDTFHRLCSAIKSR